MLDWDSDQLFTATLEAMQATETAVFEELASLYSKK
jgi:hypothetical protein